MSLDFNSRRFRTQANVEHGETSPETIFHYSQEGEIITAQYAGGAIVKGQLLGQFVAENEVELVYHQINLEGELLTGKCLTKVEVLADGRYRLHEEWQWTCGLHQSGVSTVEEF
ncbi:n-acetylglutamate synthase [Marinilongibacter aquaticus]|uniref:n-acetylglutamate synthase n=1 Tax=Marinilongibacter aquaticus TaxID=2975157 RepID=UPI0021BDCC8B|nr:n-acetylglutamate synthase [Marinilongibacter aquaticus]UBM60886.1 n-acetylglutamate synthase [Marinilongibacter aquaticus]